MHNGVLIIICIYSIRNILCKSCYRRYITFYAFILYTIEYNNMK